VIKSRRRNIFEGSNYLILKEAKRNIHGYEEGALNAIHDFIN